MFHNLVCLLLLAFLNIMYCVSPPFNGDSTGRTTTTHAVKYSHNLQNIYNNQHNKLYRRPGSKQVHKLPERSKRGIVLIDEDFNVKPDTRVMKDRNEEEGAFDLKVDSTLKTTPRSPLYEVHAMSEGSGSSETMSDELNLMRLFMTPRNLQMTRLLDEKTTVAGGNISVKKSTRFAGPDNLHQIPRLPGQEATAGADEDIEASGDGDSSTVIDSSKTTIDEDTSSKYATPSTEDPDTIRFTKNEDISSKHASPSTEGPEEFTSSRYATDNDTSSSHVVDVTETSTSDMFDFHDDMCLNITCDAKDLLTLPNLSKAVPEGTNLTISCILPNATEQGLLKWYKYYSSDLLLLEENNGDHSVHFVITSTVLHHAGTYICYKFTEHFCCSKKLEITVYKVPNYKKHLIVIGGIAAASLLLCTLVGICKCMKTKNYEKKVDLQNAEKPFLI